MDSNGYGREILFEPYKWGRIEGVAGKYIRRFKQIREKRNNADLILLYVHLQAMFDAI